MKVRVKLRDTQDWAGAVYCGAQRIGTVVRKDDGWSATYSTSVYSYDRRTVFTGCATAEEAGQKLAEQWEIGYRREQAFVKARQHAIETTTTCAACGVEAELSDVLVRPGTELEFHRLCRDLRACQWRRVAIGEATV